MRAGWNADLERLTRRADPEARIILEAVATTAEDVRARRDEWQGADSLAGLSLYDDGAVRLTETGTTLWSVADHTSVLAFTPLFEQYITLQFPVQQARAEFGLVTFQLVSQVDVTRPVEVARWSLQLHALSRWQTNGDAVWVDVVPLADPLLMNALGTITPSDITFDYRALARRPRVPAAPSGTGPTTYNPYPYPTIFARLRPLRADGSHAANAGVAVGGTPDAAVTAGFTQLIATRTAPAGMKLDSPTSDGPPRGSVQGSSFAAATISFSRTTAPINVIDLGTAPSADVELVGQGEAGGGTSLGYEVLADDGVWIGYRDGDLADTDNRARGGTDLSAGSLHRVSRRQTYALRATLTPNALNNATPTLRTIGARAARIVDLDGVATLQSLSAGADPVTLRGEISEAAIVLLHDGERDYRDAASDLLSGYDLADLEFRAWLGHDRLPRSAWMLLDSFSVDDYAAGEGATSVTGLSALARARSVIPPPVINGATVTRTPLQYANVTLAGAYADLLSVQIGLPERYRGALVADTSATVSKRIEQADGKDELDMVARLAGGAVISSQGRVKFVDLFGESTPVAIFPSAEIVPTSITPGLRQRVPEFFVPFSWQEEGGTGRFLGEVRSFHQGAIESIGSVGLDAPRTLEDGVARWVDTQALAERIGRRTVESLGAGLIQWSLQTPYPHPELEIGDLVAVQTDRFVARDPVAARALAGSLWALGVVAGIGDPWGRELTIWVRRYSDLYAGSEAVDVEGYKAPAITRLEPAVDALGALTAAVEGNADTASHRVLARTDRLPTVAEVRASPTIVAARTGTTASLLTLAPGQSVYVGALAYTRADGTGRESALVTRTLQRTADAPKPSIDSPREIRSGSGTSEVQFRLVDPANRGGTLRVWVAKDSTSEPDPSAAPDGAVAVAATPFIASGTTAFGAAGNLLTGIRVPVRTGKKVYAEFVTSDGASSGKVPVELRGLFPSFSSADDRLDPLIPMSGGFLPFRRGFDGLGDVQDDATYRRVGAGYTDTSNRLISVYRGALVEPVSNLFKKGSDTLGEIVATATRTFISPDQVGSDYRVININRAGVAAEPVSNLFKRTADSTADVAPSAGRHFISDSYVDAAFRPHSVFRNGVVEGVTNLFNKVSENTASILSDGTKQFINGAYVSASLNPHSLYRGGAQEPANNLFKIQSNSLGEVLDSTSYRRTAAAYVDASNRITAVERAGIEPVTNFVKYATDAILDSQLSSNIPRLNQPNQVTYTLRTGAGMSGGGTLRYNASGITWSQRLILLSMGRGASFAAFGYFDIALPADGTVIPGVGGATSKTVTAGYIPLATWEALYYILPLGGGPASQPGNFRLVNYTADFEVPNGWVLVAIHNLDNGTVRWGNGVTLKYGQSWAAGEWLDMALPATNLTGTIADARLSNNVALFGAASWPLAAATRITWAGDTALYRNSSGVLKTDGSFVAAGDIWANSSKFTGADGANLFINNNSASFLTSGGGALQGRVASLLCSASYANAPSVPSGGIWTDGQISSGNGFISRSSFIASASGAAELHGTNNYLIPRSAYGIQLQDYAGAARGYVYFGSGAFGLVGNTGGWAIQIPDGTNNVVLPLGSFSMASPDFTFSSGNGYLHRVRDISFDWAAGYDTSQYHGIRSVDYTQGTYADHLTLNSYGDLVLRIDSNNNGTNYIRFCSGVYNGGQVGYMDEAGNLNMASFTASGRVYGATLETPSTGFNSVLGTNVRIPHVIVSSAAPTGTDFPDGTIWIQY